MGHTTEQRDTHALCGAMTKRGVPCRAFAGQGTDHPGFGTCKFHFGATPNGKKKAGKLEAIATMVKLGVPTDDVDPHQALLALVRTTAAHVGWLLTEIRASDDLSEAETRVKLELYAEERDRLARYSEAASKAGVNEKMIARQEDIAGILVGLMEVIVQELDLEDRREEIGEAIRHSMELNAQAFADADEVPSFPLGRSPARNGRRATPLHP